METAGLGYKDGDAPACASGYTYVDPYYPATGDMLVDEIFINNTDAGTNFKIGVGTLNDHVFTPRYYVTLASVPAGQQTFNAPSDFTAFEMYAGEHIYFYSHSDHAKPDRTTWGTPDGSWYISGDHMDDASFSVSEYANTAEVQLRGDTPPSGWDMAEVNGQDPSNIDTVENQSLDNIDKIDDQ